MIERLPLGLFASFDLSEIILDSDWMAYLVLSRSQASFAIEADVRMD